MKTKLLIIFLAFLLSHSNAIAQKTFTKALGYPEKFSPALDVLENEMLEYLSRPSVYSKRSRGLFSVIETVTRHLTRQTESLIKNLVLRRHYTWSMKHRDGWK